MNIRDFVRSRGDIKELRKIYKQQAKEAGVRVRDLLALTPKNDLTYVRPSDLDKAEWFAEVWESEGGPEIHPRGLHYRILGKGYERPRKDEAYVNTNACWGDMKDGAFVAQVLGLVPERKILDEKNPDPTITSHTLSDEAYEGPSVFEEIKNPYSGEHIPSKIWPPSLSQDDAKGLVESEASRIVRKVFKDVRYDAQSRQEYYIEIWAEKAGVIDKKLARKYGATIRPAGGGEMSYKMCRDAVERAKRRDQDLVVVMSVDFDPKGRDMPKSVARKIELLAALKGIHAHVHHAAVTLAQVEEHGLPGTPAKTPKGLEDRNPGALGYETHKQIFKEFAGQDPVEIQAFSGREPASYRDALERYLEPYYDENLAKRIDDAIEDAKDDAKDAIKDALDESDVQDALDDLDDAIGDYKDEIGDEFDEIEEELDNLKEQSDKVKEETGLDESVEELEDLLDISIREALSDVDVDLPETETGEPPIPLLDTEREFWDQLEKYKEFDIRHGQ